MHFFDIISLGILLYHFWKIGSNQACFFIKKRVNFLILEGDVIPNFRLHYIRRWSLVYIDPQNLVIPSVNHLMLLHRFMEISAMQVVVFDNSILATLENILTHRCHVYYFDYQILIYCHFDLHFQCGTYQFCMKKCMIHITHITISNIIILF